MWFEWTESITEALPGNDGTDEGIGMVNPTSISIPLLGIMEWKAHVMELKCKGLVISVKSSFHSTLIPLHHTKKDLR